MTWIYLSPHLDDAALSCGGLIAHQTSTGETVEIWTICAGDPPPGALSPFAEELHLRWGTGREATALRRQEDLASCAQLSATCRHLPVPDCIYRQAGLDYWRKTKPVERKTNSAQTSFLYPNRDTIFAALHPQENDLVDRLARALSDMLPPESELLCPLTLGGHVDHRLTRAAAESLGRELWYYADYPYVMEHGEQIAALEAGGWLMQRFPISQTAVETWFQAVAAHKSQISTFWPDLSAMQAAIQAYYDQFGGAVVWKKG
jgi:LmbE family N-acetylglucosaminyl deacetylase